MNTYNLLYKYYIYFKFFLNRISLSLITNENISGIFSMDSNTSEFSTLFRSDFIIALEINSCLYVK